MHRLLALVVAAMLLGCAGHVQAGTVVNGRCASTPAAALLAARSGAEPAAATIGYRVDLVRWDPLLRQSWAVIASCDHPERSPITLLTGMLAPHLSARVALTATPLYVVLPIVRAGDVVRLWRLDRFVHIEMIGTAEQNAAVGSRVRIRLPASLDRDGQVEPPQYLAGVVRGPADVEMAQ